MDYALMALGGVLVIVAVTVLAPRAGVAAPLVLVAVGIAASFVPGVPSVDLSPEVILAGVLPPLLYSTAVSMPTMEFRRDFAAISGLSVVLVVLSSVAVGFLLWWLIPGIPLAIAIALGAVISPTDAVATSIVKKLGVSPRVVAVLEGESLLNDASALVLLRSAVAATAVSVTLLGVAWDFVLAVVIAVAIGVLVGMLNLRVRHAVRNEAASTAVSFVAPFIAYLPAEHLGASGLVAAVTAGIVTGRGAAKYLRPQDRIAERSNWGTVNLLLEGGVFLLVGLELVATVTDVGSEAGGPWAAVRIGALAAVAIVVLRAGYVAVLLLRARQTRRRGEALREQLPAFKERLRTSEASPERIEQAKRRVRRKIADIDYVAGARLGWREGTVLVWAGMRGAVTVAAAQTLPLDTPQRPFLLLVAFVVAIGTLFVQGGTLGPVVRWLGVGGADAGAAEERTALLGLMQQAAFGELKDAAARRGLPGDARDLDGGERRAFDPRAVERVRAIVAKKRALEGSEGSDDERSTGDAVQRGPWGPEVTAEFHDLRLRVIEAQRAALLDARSLGTYSSSALQSALDLLDADQISLELRGGS
ncbi:peptidase [Paraoerskovia sediminicola]|uniref:Peptidase n=1 Tax=Paraoerskovia sediminicola TaxID=1138587 RepID=A0ABM8G192_9CELL|nr:cation:proton antiporter [Paraoerskovia sediminicola]BDZ41828.1 peptidase [Paraoerskovia sediminicola]